MKSGCLVGVQEGAGSLMVCEPITTNYCFIFFSLLEVWVLFAVSNFKGGFMCLWNEEMQCETSVTVINT
jgi:hypothetical protein